jgi:hypothetical protein
VSEPKWSPAFVFKQLGNAVQAYRDWAMAVVTISRQKNSACLFCIHASSRIGPQDRLISRRRCG